MSEYTHKATGSDAIRLTAKQSRKVATELIQLVKEHQKIVYTYLFFIADRRTDLRQATCLFVGVS